MKYRMSIAELPSWKIVARDAAGNTISGWWTCIEYGNEDQANKEAAAMRSRYADVQVVPHAKGR